MKISIITPTKNRHAYLFSLHNALSRQTFLDWEWLILDTSASPTIFSDPKISYHHLDQEMSIGSKRNWLTQKATGEIIVQCDDDDYYAPIYLEKIYDQLKDADFFNLSSWFCYETVLKEFYYWDTEKIDPTHFILSPAHSGEVKEIHLNELWNEKQRKDFVLHCKQGYGFSYAYRREVLKKCPFEDRSFGEDFAFFELVKNQNFRIKTMHDHMGLVMHRLHGNNTAKVFPQYKIPPFMAHHYFPELTNE